MNLFLNESTFAMAGEYISATRDSGEGEGVERANGTIGCGIMEADWKWI